MKIMTVRATYECGHEGEIPRYPPHWGRREIADSVAKHGSKGVARWVKFKTQGPCPSCSAEREQAKDARLEAARQVARDLASKTCKALRLHCSKVFRFKLNGHFIKISMSSYEGEAHVYFFSHAGEDIWSVNGQRGKVVRLVDGKVSPATAWSIAKRARLYLESRAAEKAAAVREAEEAGRLEGIISKMRSHGMARAAGYSPYLSLTYDEVRLLLGHIDDLGEAR